MVSKIILAALAVLCCAQSISGLTIVSRSEWGAAPARSKTTLPNNLAYCVIHHTAEPYCATKAACMQEVRNIQYLHQITLGWDDIGYNFLIGGDGLIYEGRGWNILGTHASGYNSISLGISFMGNYNNNKLTSAQIAAAKELLATAVSRGQLNPGYTLYGHRQVSATECPGTNLWNEIRTWANWKA